MRQPILRAVRPALDRPLLPLLPRSACTAMGASPLRPLLSLAARAPSSQSTSALGRRHYATPTSPSPPLPTSPPPPSSSSSSSFIPAPLADVLAQVAPSAAPAHPSVYATVRIHGRPYLVTAGDRLRLPFRMAGVRPGDVLRLDRVGLLGTRDVTVVAETPETPEEELSAEKTGSTTRHGHIPEAAVAAVVLGIETEPMRVLVKTKRRQRRKRRIYSKHQYTVLRIQEVVVQ